MQVLYPTDTRDPVMLEAWRRMIAFGEFLRRQPKDENGEPLVIEGHENPSWYTV